MSTVERLRRDADLTWEKINDHDFVIELYDGSLPFEKFEFYILQDYHYLITAVKNFGIIASKAPSVKEMRDVVEILYSEAHSEFDGYIEFLDRLGYSIEEVEEVDPIPVNVSYSNYLLSISSLKSYEEAITAVLPCFWSYAELADNHREKLKNNEKKLYKDWSKVYLTESYLELVEKIKRLVNIAGKNCSYEKLKNVFITSSKYEYMFWDSVYNQEGWKI